MSADNNTKLRPPMYLFWGALALFYLLSIIVNAVLCRDAGPVNIAISSGFGCIACVFSLALTKLGFDVSTKRQDESDYTDMKDIDQPEDIPRETTTKIDDSESK